MGQEVQKDEGIWISEDVFSLACGALPLVSIDFVIVSKTGPKAKVLVGRRRNSPAKDFLFTPGGRIRKGEPVLQAMCRILRNELGFNELLLENKFFLGVWDHFYTDSAFSESISTHYVNLAYRIEIDGVDPAILPSDQHSEWLFVGLDDKELMSQIHPYARTYVELALSGAPDIQV